MDTDASTDHAWVVIITRGAMVTHAPEIYASPIRATLEAERWATVLVPETERIERPFDRRWTAGENDVRLVEIDWLPVASPWIGTFWDRSGNPDPEALLLDGRRDALVWVGEPISSEAGSPTVAEGPWMVSGSTIIRGEEVHAVAQLAKLVS